MHERLFPCCACACIMHTCDQGWMGEATLFDCAAGVLHPPSSKCIKICFVDLHNFPGVMCTCDQVMPCSLQKNRCTTLICNRSTRLFFTASKTTKDPLQVMYQSSCQAALQGRRRAMTLHGPLRFQKLQRWLETMWVHRRQRGSLAL